MAKESGAALEEPRRSEADLARTLDLAQAGGWWLDPSTGEGGFSAAMRELSGLGAEREPGWEAFLELIAAADRERVERGLRRALAEGREFASIVHLQTPAGERRLILCRARATPDAGGRTRLAGVLIDLTDLEPQAAAHRAKHDQLTMAEEMTGTGSFEWDVRSNSVTWSDNLFRIFGYAPGDFEGTFEAYLEMVHPDDRAARREDLERLLREGDVLRARHRIVRRSGEVRTLDSRVRVIRDASGAPARVIGACLDVTGGAG